jgi:hypothetical protein
MMPGFILQRLIIGDVTPQSYATGVAALQNAPDRPSRPQTEATLTTG